MDLENRKIKQRNLILVYLFGIITFGIYFLYWYVSTKKDMNSIGAKIPTAWLLIIPIVNIYWMYKYCEGFSVSVKKDNNTVLWFILAIFIGIIIPAIVQIELNKIAEGGSAATVEAQKPEAPVAPEQAPVAAAPEA